VGSWDEEKTGRRTVALGRVLGVLACQAVSALGSVGGCLGARRAPLSIDHCCC